MAPRPPAQRRLLMLPRSLGARLSAAYVALILTALALLTAVLVGVAQSYAIEALHRELATESRLALELVNPLFDGDPSALDALAKRIGRDTDTRLTIIRADGVVLGDSDQSPALMDNHAGRPEVAQALATGTGEATRFSTTLQADTVYAAVALQRAGMTVGVVRVAVPLSRADAARAQVATVMVPAGLLISLLAVGLAILIARRTTNSLAHLRRIAIRLAAGDLNARAREDLPDESSQLAVTMNQMAEQLSATIRTLNQERTRLDAILTRMADGLLIVDAQDTVTQINDEAQRILSAPPAHALGRTFTQVARDHEMTACLRAARTTGQEQSRVVEQSGSRRFLRMVATPQRGDTAADACLILLQDLTTVRRLETIRRDFVSNISHELRTPLASLLALAETLADGALDDPPAARRFVDRIAGEVHQLTSLVNDLLDLSSIESGRAPIQRVPANVSAVVTRAAERLQPQARRAGVALQISSAPDVIVQIDSARIEQVMLNLIHNGIKFTPAGGRIDCRVAVHPDHVTISVRDTGVGIGPQDLPRVFERFYKADKSRAGGGTGLGLAIAKHIVELHGGAIWAESVEGQGTTMLFTLPLG
ncbi:MAG: HAMP domain-containing protein [Chloroflexi bacterium]|nr:HAMP domain-containing protein [Chloroflexota bacterium]